MREKSSKSQSRIINATTPEIFATKISQIVIAPIASSEKLSCVKKMLIVAIIPPLPLTTAIANCIDKNAIIKICAIDISAPENFAAKKTQATIPIIFEVWQIACDNGI